jgi:hypothetical protein
MIALGYTPLSKTPKGHGDGCAWAWATLFDDPAPIPIPIRATTTATRARLIKLRMGDKSCNASGRNEHYDEL